MRCGIYCRVSKDALEVENQLRELRGYAAARGWQVQEFIDHKSGKDGNRDQFKALFEAAARGECDCVLVWSLDRLSREGILQTFKYIEKLASYNVAFISLTEAHFSTAGAARDLFLAIAAWIAKQERLRVGQRTRAGLERARANGKILGRPKSVFSRDQAVELHGMGMSNRAIGRELGISESSVRRILRRASDATVAA